MALYLITYDIGSEHRDEYAPLWKRLEELKAKRILESVWLLVNPSPGMAKPIAEDFKSHNAKPDDRLLVIEVGHDAGCANLMAMSPNDLLEWTRQARF